MRSLLRISFLLFVTVCFPLICTNISEAGVNLPWSTTFNCSDWNQYSDPLNCDGLSKGGAWTCSPQGYSEQITSAANNPTGGGGKGQRHWMGDGVNNNSGSMNVNFNTGQSEFWMRWYLSFQTGFQWSSYQGYKMLYLRDTAARGVAYIMIAYGSTGLSLYTQLGDTLHYTTNTGGWNTLYPSGVSDGSWHAIEVHVKVETAGQNNGVFQAWVDGVQVGNFTTVNWGMGNLGYTFSGTTLTENAKTPNNGGCFYNDWDDIAVSNTGYISPVGGSVTHNVTCSVASYGSCSCNSPVNNGVTTTCTATPNSGYQIASGSSTCGGSLSGNTFTTGAVTSDCAVTFTTSTVAAVVNGACGLANGQSFTSAPTANLCSSGTASLVSGTGPWTWTCNGSGGGTNASCSASVLSQAALFQENFDDTNFASRGWYDSTGGTISSIEHIPGSTGSFECRFLQGGQGCNGGGPARHLFTNSDSVYVSYWTKHSSNWVGSGKTYHPHIIYLLTNLNGVYSGLAYTYLTAYIEENQGYPQLDIQDGQNIDETKIGVDLTNTTENRAVGGCNGTQAGIVQYSTDCYLSGSVHWNGIVWKGATAYFFDANQKTNWHHVEAYLQLNTIFNGIGQPDGIARYWYDGQLVIDHSNVIIRTGKNPTMQFNQLIIGPYIGDGSPVDQTFWIDNLTVATSRTSDTMPPKWPGNVR